MWCTQANMSKKHDRFLFNFEDRDEQNPKDYQVEIKYTNEVKEQIITRDVAFKDKQEAITDMLRSFILYIPNSTDAKLFFEIFQMMFTFFDYPMFIKKTPYPGKELIVIDYSITIDKEHLESLSQSIIFGLEQKVVTDSELAEEETTQVEETKNPIEQAIEDMNDSTEYAVPFTGSGNGEFLKDDFELGVVDDD